MSTNKVTQGGFKKGELSCIIAEEGVGSSKLRDFLTVNEEIDRAVHLGILDAKINLVMTDIRQKEEALRVIVLSLDGLERELEELRSK